MYVIVFGTFLGQFENLPLLSDKKPPLSTFGNVKLKVEDAPNFGGLLRISEL